MSGLCRKCMFNGDVEKCATAVCGQHESWYGVTQRATIEAQAAEIAELKDEVDNLTDELMFRPTYLTLTERIAELMAGKLDADTNAQEWEVENKELRKAIQAIDDIVYEECDAGMMAQIWAIVETVKEVE